MNVSHRLYHLVRLRQTLLIAGLTSISSASMTASASATTTASATALAHEPVGATDDPVPDAAVEPDAVDAAAVGPAPATAATVGSDPAGEGSDADATDPTSEPEGPAEDEDLTNSQRSGTALSGQAQVADDGLPERAEVVGKQKKRPKNLTHFRTGGVSVGFGMGYGLVTAGDKYCGEFSSATSGDADGRKSLCTGATPPALDFGLSYGAHPRIDVVVAMRLGLTPRDYDDSSCESGADTCEDGAGLFVDKRAIGVMPGIRLWGVDNDKVFKVGGAIDLVYMREDFTGYRERPLGPGEDQGDEANYEAEENVGDAALGMRGGPILQVDPHHNFGIFFMPAAVISFRPAQDGASDAGWFETAFEASLGVQARFP